MEVHCEGCAGCCLDWRPLAATPPDHERRGPHTPIDDVYNLVPLTRDDVHTFLDAGLADAMTPRLWEEDTGVDLDGYRIAAIDDKPVFFLGLRQPRKPVAPFGADPAWLRTCVFLDPTTLQCRIHDTEYYPVECAEYPGHNLELGAETECERVEANFGGTRLLDDTPPRDLSAMLLGAHAIGAKIFVHPNPDRLSGVVDRIADRSLTRADRAEFVAAAAAGAPGTTTTNADAFEAAYDRAMQSESWVARAIAEWNANVDAAPDPELAERIEDANGAPPTPGWD